MYDEFEQEDDYEDEYEMSAPAKAPETLGQDAAADPDDGSYLIEGPTDPDMLQAYGVEDVLVHDVQFDSKPLQMLHKHPVLGTVSFLILGSIITGIIATTVMTIKCAAQGVAK